MSSVADVPSDAVKLVEIDQGQLRQHVDGLVRDAVEETLNALLDAEADQGSVQSISHIFRGSPASSPHAVEVRPQEVGGPQPDAYDASATPFPISAARNLSMLR